jgi:hypothetical protein
MRLFAVKTGHYLVVMVVNVNKTTAGLCFLCLRCYSREEIKLLCELKMSDLLSTLSLNSLNVNKTLFKIILTCKFFLCDEFYWLGGSLGMTMMHRYSILAHVYPYPYCIVPVSYRYPNIHCHLHRFLKK